MRKGIKRILAGSLSLMLAVGLVPNDSVLGSFSALDVHAEDISDQRVEPIKDIDDVVTYYRDENDSAIGYETIMVDGSTYYDISNNKSQALDLKTIQDLLDAKPVRQQKKKTTEGETPTEETPELVGKSLLQKWGKIAVAMIDDLGYDGWYSCNHINDNAFNNYKHGRGDQDYQINLEDVFSERDANAGLRGDDVQGRPSRDYASSTSLVSFNNLNELRKRMCQDLAKANSDDLSERNFLSAGPGRNSDSVLPKMKETKALAHPGLAKIVTTLNQNGYTADYDYASFGIAFYDFKLVPIRNDQVTTLSDLDNYLNEDNPIKAASLSGELPSVSYSVNNVTTSGTGTYVINKNDKTEDVTRSNNKNITETMSHSVTDDKDFSLGITFTNSWSWKTNCLLAEGGMKLEWSVGGEHGWGSSETGSTSKSTSKDISGDISITAPPHTAVALMSNQKKDSWAFNYKFPAALTYKVVIFGMSGHFYSDGVGANYINTPIYNHACFTMFLGGDNPEAGLTANENLKKRLSLYYNPNTVNKNQTDKEAGITYTWSSHEDLDKEGSKNYINWDNIKKDISNIEDYPKYNPMLGAGSKISYEATTVYESAGDIIPLYPLQSVELKNDSDEEKTLLQDEILRLYPIEVEGLDTGKVPYYGFNKNWGEWKIAEEPSDQSSGSEGQNTNPVGEITTTKNGNQIFTAKNPGTIQLKWVLKKGKELVSKDGEPITAENFESKVNSPIITIKVKETRDYEAVGIELTRKNSARNTLVNNLNDLFEVSMVDYYGSEYDADVIWRPQNTTGIDEAGYEVEENGDIRFSRNNDIDKPYQVVACDRLNPDKVYKITPIQVHKVNLTQEQKDKGYQLLDKNDNPTDNPYYIEGTGVKIASRQIPFELKGADGNTVFTIEESPAIITMPACDLVLNEIEKEADLKPFDPDEAGLYWGFAVPEEEQDNLWIGEEKDKIQYDLSDWLYRGSYEEDAWETVKDDIEYTILAGSDGATLSGSQLTVTKPGEYVIEAKMKENEYTSTESKSISFTVEEIGEEVIDEPEEETVTLAASKLISVVLEGDGAIQVTYEAPQEKDGVYIQCATDDLFTKDSKYTKVEGDTEKAIVKDLDESKTWKVRVFAYEAGEEKEKIGGFSNVEQFSFKQAKAEKNAQLLADKAKNLIEKLPANVEIGQKAQVVKARKAYDDYKALPKELKAIVKGFDDASLKAKLEKAEVQLKKAEKDAAAAAKKASVVRVSKIKLAGISKKIAVGKKIKLTAKVFPRTASNKKLKWTSSNKKVATVTRTGKVKIKKKTGGKTVRIIVRATDGSNVKAVWKIRSMKGVVKKIKVKGAKARLKAGKTMKLKATVKATKGANRKLKWKSSNKKYATVTQKGKVKALEAGIGKKVKITVMATDGSGKKVTKKIRITK